MATFQQLLAKPRMRRRLKTKSLALFACPQKRGICLKIYTTAPKKPNSARRKIVHVRLSSKRTVICYIPGEGHNLVNFNAVLVRGGRVPDLPGVKYKLIRNVYDLKSVDKRRHGRSKYGRNRNFWAKIEIIKFPKRPIKKRGVRQKPTLLRTFRTSIIE